jgi:nucleotide-binding universal stress UspA family protein
MAERFFKFLVVADGTPESRLAAYFAALRACHTGAKVSLLAVIQPADFHHWIGVSAEMEREAREQAESLLRELGDEVMQETGTPSEYIIREGDLRVELMHLIEEDRDIRILCLGAAPGGNPGPLVGALARGGRGMFGKRSIPVAVVPGSMTRQDVLDIA